MRTALLIEDDPGTAGLIGTLLGREGFSIDVVDDGPRAYATILSSSHSVILLDLLLPGMNGMEIIDQLRLHYPGILQRIIVVTAGGFGSARKQRSDDVYAWLQKPFDIEELLKQACECARTDLPEAPLSFEDLMRRFARAIGAKSGVSAVLDGDRLLDLATVGYEAETVKQFFPLSVTQHLPLCVAARMRAEVWLPSVELAAETYPLLVPLWRQFETQSLTAIPLIRDGETDGVMGWSFRGPREFDEPERIRIRGIARRFSELLPSRSRDDAATA